MLILLEWIILKGFYQLGRFSVEESSVFSGRWVKCPGKDFFKHVLKNKLSHLKIWVEDLGEDLKDTFRLRDYFNFSGTKVMQLAFDSDSKNIYLPHNYVKNYVVYTGNRDSYTIRGFISSIDIEHKKYIFDYFNTS